MYVSCMSHVCRMYVACMSHVCLMYVACMSHVCMSHVCLYIRWLQSCAHVCGPNTKHACTTPQRPTRGTGDKSEGGRGHEYLKCECILINHMRVLTDVVNYEIMYLSIRHRMPASIELRTQNDPQRNELQRWRNESEGGTQDWVIERAKTSANEHASEQTLTYTHTTYTRTHTHIHKSDVTCEFVTHIKL